MWLVEIDQIIIQKYSKGVNIVFSFAKSWYDIKLKEGNFGLGRVEDIGVFFINNPFKTCPTTTHRRTEAGASMFLLFIEG